MGILSRIQATGQQGVAAGADPAFDQLVQEYIARNPNGAPQMQPEPQQVSAPVPDAGPSVAMPASAAPRMSKKKRGGVLGALESVFMPEADSLWASALRNGIWDAKAGQQAYQQGLSDKALATDTQVAQNTKTRADAVTAERRSRFGIAGNNVIDYGEGEAAPSFIPAPTTPSETERLIEKWQGTPPGPLRDLLERAIKGYQYTPPVINAQAAARTNTGVTVARVRGDEARKTKRVAGASSGGKKAGGSKMPTGYILN